MLRAASRARLALSDSAALVAGFIAGKFNEDGGFKGRAAGSDLYYTVFGIEALMALEAEIHPERIARYLTGFGDGGDLDLVYLACLARCWADTSQIRNVAVEANLRRGIVRHIEAHRSRDGGYAGSRTDRHGTAYGCFLALGAMDGSEALLDCIESLRTPDGGYSNDPTMQVGATPVTAAALTIRHYLDESSDDASAQWLLSQLHPKGGFVAVPVPGSYGMPDLLSTATALHALSLTGVPTRGTSEKCLDFLDSLWSTEGAFAGSWADPALDCEYTYYGLLALGHLSGPDDADKGPGE